MTIIPVRLISMVLILAPLRGDRKRSREKVKRNCKKIPLRNREKIHSSEERLKYYYKTKIDHFILLNYYSVGFCTNFKINVTRYYFFSVTRHNRTVIEVIS